LSSKARVLEPVSAGQLPRGAAAAREDGANPFFAVVISMHGAMPELRAHRLRFPAFPYELAGAVASDILLNVFEADGVLTIAYDFRVDRYARSTVERFASAVESVLEALCADPDQQSADVALVTAGEAETLATRWWGAAITHPTESILEVLEATMSRRGEHVAVTSTDGTSLTYAELDARATHLARRLQSRGFTVGDRVAVILKKDVSWPIATVAVLKARGCFIPIDADSPKKRIDLILDDARPRFVICDESAHDRVREAPAIVLQVDSERDSAVPPLRDEPPARSADPAYIIYTSGTTGRPKGVAIAHGSVVNLVESFRERPGFAETDVLLSVASIGFDMSIADLFLPLCVGGQLAIASAEHIRRGELARALETCRATVMTATPSVWRALLVDSWPGKSDLSIWVGGEALTTDLATALSSRGRELWNLYGPTETTVWSSAHRILPEFDAIVLGTPVRNTQIFVLEPSLQPALSGMSGEIWIGGAGVALGYVGRSELNGEKFRTLHVPGRGPVRAYRTGDLARPRHDGTLEFIGRADRQLKLRGHRIEPAEIEAVACEKEGVASAVAVLRSFGPGDARLVLYYVLGRGTRPGVDELREHLERSLPTYMVPSYLVELDAMPNTASDKIDLEALPAPTSAGAEPQAKARSFDEVEERVSRHWREVLRVEELDGERSFFEQGGDSLLAAALRRRLEGEFPGVFAGADVYRFPTILAFAAHLKRMLRTTKPGSPGESYEADARRRRALRDARCERRSKKD
jgi:amino acid adenylation domain-containing protein